MAVRTAQVDYIGDAGSLIRAAEQAAAAHAKATDAIIKSNEKLAASTTKTANEHEAAMAKLANAGKWAVGGLAAIGAASVDMAVKLEKSTAAIAAQEGISTKAAQTISDGFLSTAGKVEYSAQQIADAFSSIAGELKSVEGHALSAKESLTVMNAAMALNTATGGQLKATTEALGKVMLTYHLGASQAAMASDVLFSASKNTGLGVEALTQTVDRIKGRLGALAPSLQESAGLMDALAQHGVTGRLVMGALNGTFNTLLGTSKTTVAATKELGLSIFDNTGKFVGLSSVIAQLQPKLEGMNQQRQLEYTRALFGASANKQLLDIILQGPAAYEKATQAVSKKGAAEEAAKKQQETLHGQVETLKNAITDYGAKIGEVLVPALKKALQATSEVVDWFKKHEVAAKALAGVVTTVLGAAIGAFVAQRVAAFVAGIQTMVSGLGGLATKVVGTAATVEGADAAMATATEGAATTIDAALIGTGIGAAVVALGIAALELKEHWAEVMQGLEQATLAAANSIISALESITFGLVKIGKLKPEGAAMSPKEAYAAEIEGGPREGGTKTQTQGGIMAFFMSKGLTAAQAAGIVGNIEQESSTNPRAPGGGLFQGIGSRSALGRGSVAQQIEQAWRELSSNPEYGLAELKRAKTPEEAARIFSEHFEKPGQPMIGNRETYAREAFQAHPQTAAVHQNTRAIEGLTHAITGAPSLESLTQHAKAVHHKAAKATPNITAWAEHSIGRFAESTGQNTGPELDKLQAEFHTRAAAWCAEFATTAAMMGGANKAVRTASVATIREWAEHGEHGYRKGVSHTPQVGALMMFGNSHVGFVSAVHGNQVTTIEGNANDPGGVKRFTHSASEGDYAMPKYAASVKEMSHSWENVIKSEAKALAEAQKAVLHKQAEDTKAAQADLKTMLAAIHSGSLKSLEAVTSKEYGIHLAAEVATVHGDHTSALDKLGRELVATHKKALDAVSSALVREGQKMAATIEAGMDKLTKEAGKAWAALEKAAIETKRDAALEALENSPEQGLITKERKEQEERGDKRTEEQNQENLEAAKKRLKEAKGNENPREIKNAEKEVQRAEEAITEFAASQTIKRREKKIAEERKGIEDAAKDETKALAERTARYEAMLTAQFNALNAELAKGEVSYQHFAEKVSAILAGVGMSYTPPESVNPYGVTPTPSNPYGWPKNPSEWPAFEAWNREHAKRASGGNVYAGFTYEVGELGRELFTPTQSGVITPAGRGVAPVGGHHGPMVNVEGDMNITHRRDVDRFAHKLAHNLQFGRRP